MLFSYSMLLGIVYEFIGQFLLDFWYYPPQLNLIELPIFWGVFGIIVREIFIFFEKKIKDILLNVLLTAIVLMLLIEGINIFTKSWTYSPVNPLLFFGGWILLVLTFYVIPKKIGIFK